MEKQKEAEQLELKKKQEEQEKQKEQEKENEMEKEMEKEKEKIAELPPPQAAASAVAESTGESTEDSHSERSESAVKEVPMSGDRNRFSRSKSPKPRWQGENGATDSQSSIETQTSTDKPADGQQSAGAKETKENGKD